PHSTRLCECGHYHPRGRYTAGLVARPLGCRMCDYTGGIEPIPTPSRLRPLELVRYRRCNRTFCSLKAALLCPPCISVDGGSVEMHPAVRWQVHLCRSTKLDLRAPLPALSPSAVERGKAPACSSAAGNSP